MNYIVLDLEWNQSNCGPAGGVEGLPFEIIEIGAVKLNAEGAAIGTFSQLIKPQVYLEMNQITGKLIHLEMYELQDGQPFEAVAKAFLEWCGKEEYLFCTWGSLDLLELQRNMNFYQMNPLSEGPMPFLDVQKVFSLAFEDGKSRRSLKHAVEYLNLDKENAFHRALGDACYTAKILKVIMEKHENVLKNVSYDVFRLPKNRKAEVRVLFDNYMKYISRTFETKADALSDREVSSSKCYLCRHNVKKVERWFSPNGRHYYCLGYCEKHGYLKGKIRLRKAPEGRCYVVKTTKLISKQEAEALRAKSRQIKDAKQKKKQGR